MVQEENLFAEDSSLLLRKVAPFVDVENHCEKSLGETGRVTSVQKLTDDHKQQRRHFCERLLARDEDFVQRII